MHAQYLDLGLLYSTANENKQIFSLTVNMISTHTGIRAY